MKGLTKGILLCGIISFIFMGVANAGEKTAAVSKQEAEKLAIEHQTYGNKYDDNGQFKEAIEEYKKSLEYVSDNAETLFNLAIVYLKANKPTEAAVTLEKLVKLSANDAEGYTLLGIAYRGCGKETEAKSAWERSLEINPDQPKVKEMLNDKVSKQ
ncbi:MAG: tetratricopeptide repeat protein [Deltaproteobacteria bacterium]|nr:tetratricopeptide repeat protein [Deltaproteobacteria bacterium]